MAKNKEEANKALLAAAKTGDAKALQKALDNGADVNFKDKLGASAISFAAENGHEDIVRMLSSKKGDVNAVDSHGKTALHYAAERGHSKVVDVLIEKGADTTIKDKSSAKLTAADYANEKGDANLAIKINRVKANNKLKPEDGITDLVNAIEKGDDRTVIEILGKNSKIDVNLPDRNNKGRNQSDQKRPPIEFAIENKNHYVAKLLIDHGAMVNSDMLALAVELKDTKISKLLMDNGAKINAGMIESAVENKDMKTLKLLAQNGADLEAGLREAKKSGNKEAEKFLKEEVKKEKEMIKELAKDIKKGKTSPGGLRERLTNENKIPNELDKEVHSMASKEKLSLAEKAKGLLTGKSKQRMKLEKVAKAVAKHIVKGATKNETSNESFAKKIKAQKSQGKSLT